MFFKRSRCLITLLLIVILILPLFPTPVSAAYENTYKNTGNMRNDIVGVALTQVGYKEGSNNYTKYGEWYGLPNSAWCGMFVSWCAKEAGIPTSILKRTGVANPKNFGLSYKSGTEYTPSKGDLFFKKSFSHVGIVYYTEGDYFYTIEGNTSTTSTNGDSVMIRKRKISDFYFSSPNYSGTGSNTSDSSDCSHSYKIKTESAHPHKEYKICTKCSKKTYTGNKKVVDSCKTCLKTNCMHTFGQWKKANGSKHSQTCSKCGVKQTENHNWKIGKTLVEATCVDSGKAIMICSGCNAETTKKIDATGKHKFGSITFVDETKHAQICTLCSMQITTKHTAQKKWKHDSIYHWTSCADCGGQLQKKEHRHPDGCLSPCDTCGYTEEDGHKLTGNRSYTDEVHWDICDKCNLQVNEQVHQFTSDCDEICNTCGYQRTVTAAHQDTYNADETGHWSICASCARVTDLVSHVADQNAPEWEDQHCIHCNYLLRSDEKHVHSFDSVEMDSQQHWGTCACGEIMAPEVHSWDFQTGACSICSAENASENESENFMIAFISRIFG